MPYIKENTREELIPQIEALQQKIKSLQPPNVEFDPGVWNYTLTKLLHEHIIDSAGQVSYTKLNAVIGMIECMKIELYRQVLAPYEDLKKDESGPVSSLDDNSNKFMSIGLPYSP